MTRTGAKITETTFQQNELYTLYSWQANGISDLTYKLHRSKFVNQDSDINNIPFELKIISVINILHDTLAEPRSLEF